MARATAVSYCSPKTIDDWNCTPCKYIDRLEIESIIHDPKYNFQGFVAYDTELKSILIAFRGSMDVKNWIDNLTFYKTRAFPRLPSVEIHLGFYYVYQSVATQLLNGLAKLKTKYPQAKLSITGHSLGAAVASICAFDLALNHNTRIDSVWTFGSPRIGNDAWTQYFHKLIPVHYRITHYRDVVPHIPFKWMGFMHLTQEVYYDQTCSSYRVCTEREDKTCSNRCSPLHCDSIVDHLTYLNVTMSHLHC